MRLHLAGQTGGAEAPRSALAALAQVLDSFAHSEGVAVLPSHAELTTHQAADALHVSRPFLIGVLDDGQIEYRTVEWNSSALRDRLDLAITMADDDILDAVKA